MSDDEVESLDIEPADIEPADSDDEIVLPWWQNPLNFIALGLAALILGVGIGYYVGDRNASPTYNKVDVGFLQDMRYHHEQAVDMAYFYLTSGDETHPRLRLYAQEILYSQQMEVGRMIEMLRSFREPEANDTGTAMGWMGMTMPIDDMDGLATQEQLDDFAAASGVDASVRFAELMIEHHRGGLHMAEYAAENARNPEVKDLARSMIAGQQPEIDAMTTILEELKAAS
jgi:uncharacterized protein (DUF305 family)